MSRPHTGPVGHEPEQNQLVFLDVKSGVLRIAQRFAFTHIQKVLHVACASKGGQAPSEGEVNELLQY